MITDGFVGCRLSDIYTGTLPAYGTLEMVPPV
jgi:hypothetical protein